MQEPTSKNTQQAMISTNQPPHLQLQVQHNLAVFPLPIFLLPEGRQRLRIFEKKYLSMIANASKGEGFVIARSDKQRDYQVSSWGIKVAIVDFNMGDDNILEVDVEGIELVKISNFTYQDDGLLIGSALATNHWSRLDNNEPTPILSAFLEKLFQEHELIQSLYSNTKFDDPIWVCSRLIEILPISLGRKETFLSPTSFPSLVALLNEVVSGSTMQNEIS
ncbi:LON peptidase substrate-binding domain-containing protein [Vibrio gallaecicus]|uniref:LON peptidase substrate-binding domain-containing protein n=2 Tax=Vibrio gallaecicus TaxID=552386 RepID=UPI0010C9AD65|nr:LON peptidase substrate-binding domain-containing protein [Vibrio gallaecicus]